MEQLEQIILEIAQRIRMGKTPGERQLGRLIRQHNRGVSDSALHHAKKDLLPFYLQVKESHRARWESWGIDAATEQALVRVLQVKPRRTASGVATISVLTKPWGCSGACIYCPNDVRMPKSYIYDEPACQRAEHNCFDPYLQVATRLRALSEMGHPTDKVELIVLGGTWDDYPRDYRIWFIHELFRALNDGDGSWDTAMRIRSDYRQAGVSIDPVVLQQQVQDVQRQVNAGNLGFNQAIEQLYGQDPAWREMSRRQTATMQQLAQQQLTNQRAAHRVVGLVVETRPDAVDADSLTFIRQLGCTKLQIGVQSTSQEILDANGRGIDVQCIADAFAMARVFGFKIHAHIMVNLLGADAQSDKLDYQRFVTDPAFSPDEVKLYPCSLIEGTPLVRLHRQGAWKPYNRDQLVDVLVADVLATPAHVRVSRMIRDIPSNDIMAGNKTTNLRQMVEQRIDDLGLRPQVREVRMREIATNQVEVDQLDLQVDEYQTTSTTEHFLQWVTPQGGIAGFLRLSLPRQEFVAQHAHELPVGLGQAMIREVHVYGRAARLHQESGSAQHMGLGRQLVEHACEIARQAGYSYLNVISAVGTREYYRNLGFDDAGLYQRLAL